MEPDVGAPSAEPVPSASLARPGALTVPEAFSTGPDGLRYAGDEAMRGILPAYAGESLSTDLTVPSDKSPFVGDLMRDYTTYGSWSPDDQLDATNALARIRERLGYYG